MPSYTPLIIILYPRSTLLLSGEIVSLKKARNCQDMRKTLLIVATTPYSVALLRTSIWGWWCLCFPHFVQFNRVENDADFYKIIPQWMSIIFLHSAHSSVFPNTLINTERINRRSVPEKKTFMSLLITRLCSTSYPLISNIFRSCDCLDSEITDAVSDFEPAVHGD
jgi:hypothetical protein